MSKHKCEIVVLFYMSQAPSDENSKHQSKVWQGSGTATPDLRMAYFHVKANNIPLFFFTFHQLNAYNNIGSYDFY